MDCYPLNPNFAKQDNFSSAMHKNELENYKRIKLFKHFDWLQSGPTVLLACSQSKWFIKFKQYL